MQQPARMTASLMAECEEPTWRVPSLSAARALRVRSVSPRVRPAREETSPTVTRPPRLSTASSTRCRVCLGILRDSSFPNPELWRAGCPAQARAALSTTGSMQLEQICQRALVLDQQATGTRQQGCRLSQHRASHICQAQGKHTWTLPAICSLLRSCRGRPSHRASASI